MTEVQQDLRPQSGDEDDHICKAAHLQSAARSRDCYNPCVHIDTEHWLRIHGRPQAPKLETIQLDQFTESFNLVKSSNGGTVEAGELGAALSVADSFQCLMHNGTLLHNLPCI
jgi:hypothetical protein